MCAKKPNPNNNKKKEAMNATKSGAESHFIEGDRKSP
tara:strand:+ start:1236 stop:1346 length:111 start_codon:yes stop_codon:yes gene_type:complete